MDTKNFFVTYNMVSPPEDIFTENTVQEEKHNPLERLKHFVQKKQEVPKEDTIIENQEFKNDDISFAELVKQEKLPIYITSSYRKESKTKNGSVSNHSKLDTKGNPLAYDIQPFFNGQIDKSENGFNKLRDAMYSNPRVMNWLKQHGFGILEEITPDIMRRTGATGKHFHVGVDAIARKMTTERTGLQYAQQGAKFVEYIPFESLPETILNIPEFNYDLLQPEDETLLDEVLNEVVEEEDNKKATYTKDYSSHSNMKFNTKRDFIKTMAPIIKKELDKIGQTFHLYNVLAQMALESGWGKHQSGKNNFAGLKATSSEKGTMRRTKEYEGQQVVSKFKDFDSIEEFAKYYVDRLNRKFRAFDSGDYTANIKRRGYFTANENQYRQNLNSIKQSIQNLV